MDSGSRTPALRVKTGQARACCSHEHPAVSARPAAARETTASSRIRPPDRTRAVARSQYEAMRHWPHGLVAISVRLMRRNLRSAHCETCRAGLGQTADSMLLVSGTQVEARRGRAGPGIAASSATRHNISTRVAPRLTRRRGSRRCGRSLSARRDRVGGAAAARRHQPRSTAGRSHSPRPRTGGAPG